MRDPVIEGVPDPAESGRPRGFWHEFAAAIRHLLLSAVLAFVFFAIVSPLSIILRLFGVEALEIRFDPRRKSYWIERRPPGPGDMSRQS